MGLKFKEKLQSYIVEFQKVSIHSPQKGLEFPGGGSVRPKKFNKFTKLNWNFQRGREVWIFSGTTHFRLKAKRL